MSKMMTMITSKMVVVTLSIIGIAVVAAALLGPSTKTEEHFWNIPDRKWKVERVFEERTPCGPDFVQTPGFQGILSPRFSNVNYGPYLRTSLPDYAMTGVPADPLGGDFGGSFYAANSGPMCCGNPGSNATIVEGYDTIGPNCTNTNRLLPMNEYQRLADIPCNPSGYANGDYKRNLAALVNDDVPCTTELNGGDFGSYLTANGELKQPIIYDRYIYANRHSRLRALGDPIRGDLPIVPNSGNWFVPSVHPNIDLQAGAINVLAGVNNETNHQLASLIYNSSGGGETTIGGVDLEPIGGISAFSRMNMSNQNTCATVSAGGDVIMTSFP